MDREVLIEALGQIFSYTIEPLLERQREKSDLRLMTASIYAGMVAKFDYPADSQKHNRRIAFALDTARDIMERTK